MTLVALGFANSAWKDHEAWERGEGIVYVTEGNWIHGRAAFTRQDFEAMVDDFIATHHLPTASRERKVRALFDLCEWQSPWTLLDEELGDHCIWDDEWPQEREEQTHALP